MTEFLKEIGAGLFLFSLIALFFYWITPTWTKAVRAKRRFEEVLEQIFALDREYDTGYSRFSEAGREIAKKIKCDGSDLDNLAAAADYDRLTQQMRGILKNKDTYKRPPRRRRLGEC